MILALGRGSRRTHPPTMSYHKLARVRLRPDQGPSEAISWDVAVTVDDNIWHHIILVASHQCYYLDAL